MKEKLIDMRYEKKEQLRWINCVKMVAIFAVLTDHTFGVLYENSMIVETSFFSVSLFVLISGITSYISNSRSELNWWRAYLRSIKSILVAYLISTAIYLILKEHAFNFNSYIKCIFHFNASGPLYYVALYLQLMLTSRILFKILEKCSEYKYSWIIEILVAFLILGIAAYTTNRTQILDIYGGGGKLLGGTYLFLYYFGMVVAKEGWIDKKSNKANIAIWLCSSIGCFYWWAYIVKNRMRLDSLFPFGDGKNPPSITFMVFAILILFAVFAFCTLLEQNKYTDKVLDWGAWIGTHTLYIFMYHGIFLDYFANKYFIIEYIWLKRIIYILMMIAISIVVEYIVNNMLKLCKTCLSVFVEKVKCIKRENAD